MSYQPPIIKSGSGPSGVAKVMVGTGNNKGMVKVDFVDKEIARKSFILKADDCPENLISGTWVVSLNSGKDTMYSWRPVNGVYRGKVSRFTSPKDKPPRPQTHTKWDYQYFTVLFELTEPEEVAGCIVPNNYRYHFESWFDPELEKEVMVFNHHKSKYTPVLVDFCNATGVWEKGPIMATDNILPFMQKRILREDREVDLVLKDGWVIAVMAIDNPTPSNSDSDDDEDTTENHDELPEWGED